MPHKKTKRKSKHSKKKQNISKSKLINIFLLIFLFAFLASMASYFIMKNENSNKSITNNILEKEKPVLKKKEDDFQNSLKKENLDEYFQKIETKKDNFEEYTEEFNKVYEEKDPITKKENLIEKKEDLNDTSPKEIENKKEEVKEVIKYNEKDFITKRDKYKYDGITKPKIVIMIDDVSTNRQKRNIQNIGYKVNMALLPPTKSNPNTSKIAQELPFHMIHFPMQASSKFKGTEVNTLNINDSYEKIEKRVKQLREWFPNAVYTNNHTGSVFTQNEQAMNRLFKALKKYNFIFVDSRTTAKSVAKKYAKKYNMPYIVRNTFIDNNKDYSYIQNQLKKAIKIAKKKGYAIAIGHPHSITIKVLRESKDLLKGLEPIYITELPYL